MENYQLYDINIASNAMVKYVKAKLKVKMFVIEDLSKDRIAILDKIKEPSEKFKEYQQKYQELILPYAEKKENGDPVLYNGVNGTGGESTSGKGLPYVVENIEEFAEKKAELDLGYTDTLKEYEDSEKEWFDMMQKEVDPEIKFSKIDIEEFPDEIPDEEDGSNLYDKYLRVLMPIIKY